MLETLLIFPPFQAPLPLWRSLPRSSDADLLDVNEDLVVTNKKCIVNYGSIDDPWDVDGDDILKYAQTQVANEQLIILDDYCIVAGTDTNFPWTNQFGVNVDELKFGQEVTDTRFMVVCFVEPVFNLDYPLTPKVKDVVLKDVRHLRNWGHM